MVNNLVVFGDVGANFQPSGNIYALNRHTGATVWQVNADPDPDTGIYSSPILAGNKILVTVSGTEDDFATPEMGWNSRGSVIALNINTGAKLWQTYTITDAEKAAGSSGATIWSSPTYDAQSNRVFVSTGQNFTHPATDTSDAVIALNASTGAIIWKNQTVAGDVWTHNQPFNPNNNLDFADSPQVFKLASGRKVVAAGQKNGVYHVFDAGTGERIRYTQLEPSSPFGGLFADSGTVDGITYLNGSDDPDFDLYADPPNVTGDGHIIAVRNGPNLSELWRFETLGSKNLGAVAIANGVVYFLSSTSGILYALRASNGEVLAQLNAGAGISGPSVARGMVFVGTGDVVGPDGGGSGGSPDGHIIAYGLP